MNTKYYSSVLSKLRRIYDNESIKQYNGFIVNLSGGIDSICTTLILKFIGASIKCLYLPYKYNEKISNFTSKFCENLYIPYKEINISDTVDSFSNCIEFPNEDLVNIQIGNIMARCRMILGRHYAHINGYVLAGTCNMDEEFIGYLTKDGDGACDIEVLDKFHKSDIYKIVNDIIIFYHVNGKLSDEFFEFFNDYVNSTEPSAELWDGQTDESELGFKWSSVELAIKNEEMDESLRTTIINQHNNSSHKRIKPNSLFKMGV